MPTIAGGCAHQVRLDTTPSGADVTVNGIPVGSTPVDFTERSGWRKRYDVAVTKPGYRPVRAEIRQTEWDQRVVLPALPVIWCPVFWPVVLFSQRARHGYHWKLERASDRGGLPGEVLPVDSLPDDYPEVALPDDYPPPPPPPPPASLPGEEE